MIQKKVGTVSRVAVYQVKIYDIRSDDMVISQRWATEEGARKMGGEIIPETRALIDSSYLEPGEGWTERGFMPNEVDVISGYGTERR